MKPTIRKPAPTCPTCGVPLCRWPGTDQFVCANCSRISITAPVNVALAPSLPILRLPSSCWPKSPPADRKAA